MSFWCGTGCLLSSRRCLTKPKISASVKRQVSPPMMKPSGSDPCTSTSAPGPGTSVTASTGAAIMSSPARSSERRLAWWLTMTTRFCCDISSTVLVRNNGSLPAQVGADIKSSVSPAPQAASSSQLRDFISGWSSSHRKIRDGENWGAVRPFPACRSGAARLQNPVPARPALWTKARQE